MRGTLLKTHLAGGGGTPTGTSTCPPTTGRGTTAVGLDGRQVRVQRQVHIQGYTISTGEVPARDSTSGTCTRTRTRTHTGTHTRVHFKYRESTYKRQVQVERINTLARLVLRSTGYAPGVPRMNLQIRVQVQIHTQGFT